MSRKRRSAADEPFLLVRSFASEQASGAVIAHHRHGWNQLVYIASGVMAVDTERGSWIAPPDWAVWVPVDSRHAIRFISRSSLRTIYLRPDQRPELPENSCSLAVSPLLRALILRTVELGMLDERNETEAAMSRLLVAELGLAGPPPFTLPQPTSEVTVRAARLITCAAPGTGNLASVARIVGIGARTLERRFRAETGLTPGRWQQQARLLKGLELIASGAQVKTAAADAGFASASAYIAAFRQSFGMTPARYFKVQA